MLKQQSIGEQIYIPDDEIAVSNLVGFFDVLIEMDFAQKEESDESN